MAASLQECTADQMALFEDADQLIADEYFNNRQATSTDSEYSFSSDENEEDFSASQAAFMDPRDLDVEEVKAVREFCAATCKCTKKKGGPCSTSMLKS